MNTLTLKSRITLRKVNFTCREIVAIYPQALLFKIKRDNRCVIDDELKEYLKSHMNNEYSTTAFNEVIELSDYRHKHLNEHFEKGSYVNSDNLALGNQRTYYMNWLSGLRCGY